MVGAGVVVHARKSKFCGHAEFPCARPGPMNSGTPVTVRRLHDAGFSGWLYLLNFVGLSIVVFVLCFLETSPNGDQYNIR